MSSTSRDTTPTRVTDTSPTLSSIPSPPGFRAVQPDKVTTHLVERVQGDLYFDWENSSIVGGCIVHGVISKCKDMKQPLGEMLDGSTVHFLTDTIKVHIPEVSLNNGLRSSKALLTLDNLHYTIPPGTNDEPVIITELACVTFRAQLSGNNFWQVTDPKATVTGTHRWTVQQGVMRYPEPIPFSLTICSHLLQGGTTHELNATYLTAHSPMTVTRKSGHSHVTDNPFAWCMSPISHRNSAKSGTKDDQMDEERHEEGHVTYWNVLGTGV